MEIEEFLTLGEKFNLIQNFSDKLKWWDENILKNYKFEKKGNSYSKIPLSPFNNIPIYKSIIVDRKYKDERIENYLRGRHDDIYFYIIPENDIDKVLFWEWLQLKEKVMLKLEDWIIYYNELFKDKPQHNIQIIIDNEFQFFIKVLHSRKDDNYNGHFATYINGRDFAIFGKRYEYFQINGFLSFDSFIEGFRNNLREVALRKIKSKMENKTIENESETPFNKNLTTEQAVMVFDYLFHELGALENSIKKSELISFLTGFSKEGLRKKHSGKSSKNYINNLQLIRPYFENLQMFNIVNRINDEIGNKLE